MADIKQLITEHMAIWTAADTEKKSGRGRASGNAGSVYGVKKLRELILELAVRGKLVPQEPNDEPANELLKRIQAEKAKLIAEGKLKKDKLLAPIGVDEKPFELPKGWEYSKLGNIATKLTDGSHNPPRDSGFGIPMLSSQNVNYGFIDFDMPSRYVTEDEFLAENSRTKIEVGDVLLTIVGTLGRAAVVQPDSPKFVLQRSVATIKTGLLPKYLCLQFGSPFCSNYFEEKGKGTAQKGIYLGQLADMLITVPPLSEQHRIVAKVDQLMALCDQLEQQHSNAQEAHETLVSELLATLTQSQNAAEFNANWQRIYAHFDVLFTTEVSIDALKQTLLQLAVMGKLVPQDPSDEPASELLKRIQAEKAKLIAEGKLKKEKPLAPIGEDEKPFELPKSWEWVRFQAITKLITDGKHGDCNNLSNSGYYFLSAKDIQNGMLKYENARQIVPSEFLEVHQRTNLESGDICMVNTGATVGKIAVAMDHPFTNRTTFQKSVAVIKVIKPEIEQKYITNFLLAEASSLLKKSGGSAINNLLLGDLKVKLVPLPPLLEQHRIVAKVNELMSLCDQLKTRIQQANQQQQAIADALVALAVA